jgi:hypothetical protein
MRLFTRTLLIGLAATALILAACGGDDDDEAGNAGDANERSATPTASGSPSVTGADESPGATSVGASPGATGASQATPTAAPTAAVPPPGKPGLDEGVAQVNEGILNFVIPANGQFEIDSLGLVPSGTDPPPCGTFEFAFSWRITDPYPPSSEQVVWELIYQDARQDVASGAEGSASVGCGQLLAGNNNPRPIAVSVYYVVGQIQP